MSEKRVETERLILLPMTYEMVSTVLSGLRGRQHVNQAGQRE